MPQITASTARRSMLRCASWSGVGVCARDACGIMATSVMAEISNFFIFLSSLPGWKHLLPIPLHVEDGPVAGQRFIQCLVELADLRLPVAGVFALASVWWTRPAKRAAACHRPLQHMPVRHRRTGTIAVPPLLDSALLQLLLDQLVYARADLVDASGALAGLGPAFLDIVQRAPPRCLSARNWAGTRAAETP